MRSEWATRTISDIAIINPRESIRKGTRAKKIPMDIIRPFTRDIPSYQIEEYKGGTKFRNMDTIMARITPCLENGKTAKSGVWIMERLDLAQPNTLFLGQKKELIQIICTIWFVAHLYAIQQLNQWLDHLEDKEYKQMLF